MGGASATSGLLKRSGPSCCGRAGWGEEAIVVTDEDEMGGDPPCWAHLFDEEPTAAEIEMEARSESSETAAQGIDPEQIVDLAALARAATAQGVIWTQESEDLDINLLVFAAGEGVAEHVNAEVDVLVVGIAGEGVVALDGTRQNLRAGHAMIIPKGARRGFQSMSDRFVYLSCHRRRGGLWPRREL
jgi:quercetin dioxygenase-like cupin family protein